MTTQEIYYEIKNHIAFVTLNREKALNSLNLNMVQKMTEWLNEWDQDPNIRAVILQSAGEKAFCAGGDVRAIYEAGKDGINGDDLPKLFFSVEYHMNEAIFFFSKPYISLMKGITMGGGLGLSVHGSHRIVDETSMLAMPEAAIGFFADVGATHFLNKAPDEIGKFIALTGYRMNAADALYAGIATHHMRHESQVGFCAQMENYQWKDADLFEQVNCVLEELTAKPEMSSALKENQDKIHICFAPNTREEIVQNLSERDDEWALKVLKLLQKGSPLSQAIMIEQLKRGKPLINDFRKIMEMEFAISQGFMKSKDFYEGVRSVLVDKDFSPKWEFSADYTFPADLIDNFFNLDVKSEEILKKAQKKAS